MFVGGGMMIQGKIKQGIKIPLSKNFDASEFACPHCGVYLIDEMLIKVLQAVRDRIGRPVIVNSGYRCPTYNAQVGGRTRSYHLFGKAADITVYGMKPTELAKIVFEELKRQGIVGGIGVYLLSNFVHVDVRETSYNARWIEDRKKDEIRFLTESEAKQMKLI